MLASSTGLATLLTSADQGGLRVRLQMTLPGNVYPDLSLTVETLSIDASITTDMPDGTRLAAGYPAMQATFTLSGLVDQRDETMTAAWLFGFYPKFASSSQVSPLYRKSVLGCSVTIDVGGPPVGGTGIEYLRKFTGTIDSMTVDPEQGTVEFTCIDYRNKLRSVPFIPAVVTGAPYNAGLTSEFVLDSLLRTATNGAIGTWPARRANCILSAGMRSSVWPDVGSLLTSLPQPSAKFAKGAFGTAYNGIAYVDTTTYGNVFYQTTSALGTTLFMEAWITGVTATDDYYFGITGTNTQNLVTLIVNGASNKITLQMQSGVAGQINLDNALVSIVGTGAHYVACKVVLPPVGGATWTGTLYVDGTSTTTTQTAPGGTNGQRTSEAMNVAIITMIPGASFAGASGSTSTLEAWQITTESAPTINYPFTPQAILDPSLNALQVVPQIDAGTDPWQVIQQICDAELGVGGFDESGLFHFYNRKTIQTMPVARTITSTMALKSISMTSDASSVANHVTVPYTSWTFSKRQLVFTNTAIWSVGAKQTQTFSITIDGTVGQLDATASVLPQGHTINDGSSWYRASTSAAGIVEHPGGLTVAISATSNGPVVTITNASNVRAYFVSPANYTDTTTVMAGNPSVWVGGLLATPANEVTVDYQYPDLANGGAVSGPRGDVAVALDSDPWIQDRTSAQVLALDLLIDLYLPRPDLGSLDIVPDPRLQLLDRVLVQDSSASGISEYAGIWGWTLTFDANTWGMTVDARTVTSPGQWILGIAGRSELGVTTYI